MGNKEPSKRQGEWCNHVAGLGLRLPWLLHNVQLAISHRETLQIDHTTKSFVWATEMNSYLTQKISYAPFDRIMSSLFNIITVVHRKDPHSPQLQQWQKRKKRQACNFPSMLKAFEEAYSDHLTGTMQNRVQLDHPQSDRRKKRKQTFKAR